MIDGVRGDRGKNMSNKLWKPKHNRWLSKGFWYWLFMILVTFGIYALALFYFGASALLIARFKWAFGLMLLIGVVGFVILTFVGSGWAQEKADQKVEG